MRSFRAIGAKILSLLQVRNSVAGNRKSVVGGRNSGLKLLLGSYHLETLIGIIYWEEGLTWWLEGVFV